MSPHGAATRPFTAGILLLLLGKAACRKFDDKQCGEDHRTKLPGEDGLKGFAQSCPADCPYATRTPDDICHARCVRKCGVPHVDPSRAFTDLTEMHCDKCTPGCAVCETRDSCKPDGCHHGFTYTDDGKCLLPMEQYVSHALKNVAIGFIVIIVFLLCCFGGVRSSLTRVVGQASNDLKNKLLSNEADEESGKDAALTEAAENLDIMKHAILQTRLSSINHTRARKRIRRRNNNTPEKRTSTVDDTDITADLKTRSFCFFQTKGMAGVGMLLFRNSQKFYFLCLVMIAISIGIMHSFVGDVGEDYVWCYNELWKNQEYWDENHLNKTDHFGSVKSQFDKKCCEKKNVDEPIHYAEAMFWWGGIMYVILATAAILFSYFQMNVVMEDENFQQGFGTDEQDYTFLLTNLPKNITSEEQLKTELEKRLNLKDKLYGVSIVYDVKEPEWEARISEMLDNLVRYDIAKQKHYSSKVKALYTKVTPLSELEEKVAKDKRDFKDWLTGEGEMGKKRFAKADKSITSGEAYVTFKRKVDLKMFLPCVSAIRWPMKHDPLHQFEANDYHMVHIKEVQWEPSDVMWMDCVPTQRGMKTKIVTASLTMLGMFIVMFALTGAVFYSSILPYKAVGADVTTSTNFNYTNQLLALVCMLIPGMPAGLAQGIGYTRMNQMEGFIFFFILCVFGIWNLTTIMVQWGIVGLFDNLEDLVKAVDNMTQTEVHAELEWSQVVPSVMFPGQLVQGYIINELLTALLPIIIPTAVSLCVYYLHVFPMCIRKIVAGAMLQNTNFEFIDAFKYETQISLQPYRLSMEYAFMMWVPMLSMTILFFLTDFWTQLKIFGGLILYSCLMMFFVHVCVYVMRDTSFDSVQGFVAFIQAWGDLLSFFPTLSVWWAMRLNWISGRVGIIMAILAFFAFRLFFLMLLKNIGFDSVMSQKMMTEAFDMQKSTWETMEKNDVGFRKVLDCSGYSWWNMNPVYVLKYRYCPNLPGYEVHPESECPVWPSGYVTKSLVQLGKDWRFKVGEDPNLAKNCHENHGSMVQQIEALVRTF